MVRLANFAAINQDRSAEQAGVAQQTLEAQEVRIIQEYELALRETQSNNSQAAEVRHLLFFKRDMTFKR